MRLLGVVALLLTLSLTGCAAEEARRVAPGVTLGEYSVGGLSVDEVREIIQAEAERLDRDAVEPRVDKAKQELLPGLWGFQVDQQATLSQILSAPEGGRRALVMKKLPPKTKLTEVESEYPIYRGNPKSGGVAFAINVAWGEEYLPQILSVLRTYSVPATFFATGDWIINHPDHARGIARLGYEFGNHSYSHPHISIMSEDAVKDEITRTDDAISAVTGLNPILFSPPAREFSPTVLRVARTLHRVTVLNSLDTADWMLTSVEQMKNRIVPKVQAGDIILMHPTPRTADVIEAIIPAIRAKGLEVMPVGKLLGVTEP
jgi:probable sporulation protein (polysaccharide deacetylase family)